MIVKIALPVKYKVRSLFQAHESSKYFTQCILLDTQPIPNHADKTSKMHTLRQFIFAWILLPATVFAASTADIAKVAFTSTVLVVTEDAQGQQLALGSGFVLRNGAIVTNLHVIEGAMRSYVKEINSKTKHNVEGVIHADSRHDLAVLSVPTLSAPAVALGDSTKLAVGDTVYAAGNPRGLEGTFSQGIVSGIRTFGTDSILQITAPISPGSSGGPILNERGEVVGVAVATFKGGQNLNFAVPSLYLSGVVLAAKPTLLSHTTTKPSDRSLLQDIGGSKSTDGVNVGQFLWSSSMSIHGDFTVSVRNSLREPVKDVYFLLIFFDPNNTPIDFAFMRYDAIIPGGLAKRITGGVDASVRKLTTPKLRSDDDFHLADKPFTKMVVRILNFSIVNE